MPSTHTIAGMGMYAHHRNMCTRALPPHPESLILRHLQSKSHFRMPISGRSLLAAIQTETLKPHLTQFYKSSCMLPLSSSSRVRPLLPQMWIITEAIEARQ